MCKYKVIYADCPWDYETPSDPRFGGATYPTMTTEELKEVPVQNIADKHSALFFWATYPKLQRGL